MSTANQKVPDPSAIYVARASVAAKLLVHFAASCVKFDVYAEGIGDKVLMFGNMLRVRFLGVRTYVLEADNGEGEFFAISRHNAMKSLIDAMAAEAFALVILGIDPDKLGVIGLHKPDSKSAPVEVKYNRENLTPKYENERDASYFKFRQYCNYSGMLTACARASDILKGNGKGYKNTILFPELTRNPLTFIAEKYNCTLREYKHPDNAVVAAAQLELPAEFAGKTVTLASHIRVELRQRIAYGNIIRQYRVLHHDTERPIVANGEEGVVKAIDKALQEVAHKVDKNSYKVSDYGEVKKFCGILASVSGSGQNVATVGDKIYDGTYTIPNGLFACAVSRKLQDMKILLIPATPNVPGFPWCDASELPDALFEKTIHVILSGRIGN